MRTLRVASLVVACLVGMTQLVRAEATQPAPQGEANPAPGPQGAPPSDLAPTTAETSVPALATPAPEEGLDLRKHPDDDDRPITETWWFWAAATGVVVTTVAIVLVAGRSQAEPKTTLGDMRAFR